YPFSFENIFRLAAYTELKGMYDSKTNGITMDFGALGRLTVYQNNCLLRTADNRVFHLDKYNNTSAQVAAMNERISELLDHIFLLGNHNADPFLIDFVDTHLARKNIEPFDKIYLRHILIQYGKLDRENSRVEFHTDWLPEQTFAYRSSEDRSVVRKPINPMKIKLDKNILRGYFIWSGGTVYVEDVKRNIVYATGEQYNYNVAAFKLFLQEMFAQSTQYIVREERSRIQARYPQQEASTQSSTSAKPAVYAVAEPIPTAIESPLPSTRKPPVRTRTVQANSENDAQSLYNEFDWIPMMLGMLRAQDINIGDPDIIRYFIDEPYFPQLYEQLNKEERRLVDSFDARP
ncbi:MAG: hypothetical protein AAFR59_07670, partial [Bacteroidota bacterium]